MIDSNIVINIGFTVIIAIMAGFYYFGIIKSLKDKFFAFLVLVASFIQLFSKESYLLDISHFLYCVVYLVLVAFVSNNKYFLGLNSLMLFFVLQSRLYYKGCILNTKQNNEGYFTDINKSVMKHFDFSWTHIFSVILAISLIRLFLVLKKED
tara:strand:+ start:1256 stop:1711 length:456 start_codon:yes stop_codon:yes gene_type:complete